MPWSPQSIVHTSGGFGSNCPPTLGFALTFPPTPGLATLGVSLLMSHNLDHLSKGSEVQRSRGCTESCSTAIRGASSPSAPKEERPLPCPTPGWHPPTTDCRSGGPGSHPSCAVASIRKEPDTSLPSPASAPPLRNEGTPPSPPLSFRTPWRQHMQNLWAGCSRYRQRTAKPLPPCQPAQPQVLNL